MMAIKRRAIYLSAAEIQSNHNRVRWAEGLILQLPKNHDGRNSWLLNYGVGEEAQAFRKQRSPSLAMDPVTESAVCR